MPPTWKSPERRHLDPVARCAPPLHDAPIVLLYKIACHRPVGTISFTQIQIRSKSLREPPIQFNPGRAKPTKPSQVHFSTSIVADILLLQLESLPSQPRRVPRPKPQQQPIYKPKPVELPALNPAMVRQATLIPISAAVFFAGCMMKSYFHHHRPSVQTLLRLSQPTANMHLSPNHNLPLGHPR